MKIYHGIPTPKKMAKADAAAPSYDHGAEWLPYRMTAHDWPYILDNGAYGGNFDLAEFVAALERLDEMPCPPDFVVLPDVHKEGLASISRSSRYAGLVDTYGYDYYLPVQDGMDVGAAVRVAVDLGASGVFVGGSDQWMLRYADQFAMTGHDYGLKCHIGKPGGTVQNPSRGRLTWAEKIGADSVDTTSIVRNGYWHRLRNLEEQETLGASA